MKTKKGFTLIELLVVVLIIGILAAIAVPQYQKAVEKSKAVQAFTLIKSVDEAMKAYFLANGNYPTNFNSLDISLPSNFNENTQFVSNSFAKSNKDWSLSYEYSNHYTSKVLYMGRISGKYKGAAFIIIYDINNSSNYITNSTIPTEKILCMERKSSGNFIFDTDLPNGSFCEKIMQGTYINERDSARFYSLP